MQIKVCESKGCRSLSLHIFAIFSILLSGIVKGAITYTSSRCAPGVTFTTIAYQKNTAMNGVRFTCASGSPSNLMFGSGTSTGTNSGSNIYSMSVKVTGANIVGFSMSNGAAFGDGSLTSFLVTCGSGNPINGFLMGFDGTALVPNNFTLFCMDGQQVTSVKPAPTTSAAITTMSADVTTSTVATTNSGSVISSATTVSNRVATSPVPTETPITTMSADVTTSTVATTNSGSVISSATTVSNRVATSPVPTETPDSTSSSNSQSLILYMSIGIAGMLLMIMSAAIYLLRRRSRFKKRKLVAGVIRGGSPIVTEKTLNTYIRHMTTFMALEPHLTAHLSTKELLNVNFTASAQKSSSEDRKTY